MAENKIKLLSDTEKDWYEEVSKYLYYSDPDGNKQFNSNTLVGKYRIYNAKTFEKLCSASGRNDGLYDGAFRINDIWLTVPPQSIGISISNKTIDLPQIRSKHSVQIDTGYGEISVNISVVFTDDPFTESTLEDEINYKLVPLMTQLRTMPFVQIENSFIKDKLIDVAEKQTGIKIADSNQDASDIMLTYVSHNISTVQESSRIIQVDFQFLLFNYKPFMNSVRYVRDYKRTNMGTIQRDEFNGKILAPTATSNPSNSKAFYEFYAKDFIRSQEYLERCSPSFYNHRLHRQNLMLTYFTYTAVPKELVNEQYKKIVEASKNNKPTIGELTYKDIIQSKVRFATKGNLPGAQSESPQIKAWLDTIAWAEGTSGNANTKNNGYDIMFGGKTFDNYSKHPNVTANFSGGKTDAAGRYQFMYNTWLEYGFDDFTPTSQDRTAIRLIDEKRHAYKDCKNVNLSDLTTFDVVFDKLSYEWASIPDSLGNPRYPNQHIRSKSEIIAKYKMYYEQHAGITEDKKEEKKDVIHNTELNTKTNTALPNKQSDWEIVYPDLDDDSQWQGLKIVGGGETPAIGNSKYISKPDLFNATNPDALKVAEKKLPETPKVNIVKPQEPNWVDELIKEIETRGNSWEIVAPDASSFVVYVKEKHIFDTQIDITKGIDIMSVENLGSHDVPRIPISGYQYATHQFLGGHVEKMRMRLIVTDEVGDNIFAKMQNIFHTVSNNNLEFKNVAYLDGIGIYNDFINTIIGGEWFTLDNTEIVTHPDIPNASIVTLDFTDYTRVKEYIKRSFEFKNDQRKHESGFMREFIREFLNIMQVKTTIEESDTTRIIQGRGGRGATASKEYTTHYISLKLESSLTNHPLLKVAQELFDEIANGINFIQGQEDVYDIRGFLDKNITYKYINTNSRLNSRNIYNSTNQNPKDKEIAQGKLYDIIYPRAGGVLLTDIIKNWIYRNYQFIYGDEAKSNLPNFAKLYSKQIINELEEITTPAYVDFDLPATIDPDYYWFQLKKYHWSGTKQEEIIKKQLKDTLDAKQERSLSKRLENYQKQLTLWGVDNPEKNILYRLFSEDSETYNNMKFKENMDSYVITNIAEEIVYNKSLNDGSFGTSMRVFKKDRDDDSKNKTPIDLGGSQRIKNIYTDNGANPVDAVAQAVNNRDPKQAINYLNGSGSYNFYTSNHNLLELLFRTYAYENDKTDNIFDMTRCFPTFKIYLVEEDDTERLAPIRNDLNEYYGLNAIQEIRLAEHSDQPIDVLTLRFLDITGKFTSARYKEKPLTEDKTFEKRDTPMENPFEGVMLKEGVRIQFRFGYTNNINNLTTKFNGQVVSIDGAFSEYQIICQSYGAELVYERKFPDGPKDPTMFNAETKEILLWAITQPEVKHFGRWRLRDLSNLQGSDSTSGLAANLWLVAGQGNYQRVRPDGKIQRTWTFFKNDADLNLMAPDENPFIGIETMWDYMSSNFFSAFIGFAGGIFSWVAGQGFKLPIIDGLKNVMESLFTHYAIYNMTPWEVIEEMTYRYPGYIAKVMPYGDRNTLFYGPADSPYYYRPMKLAEKLQTYNFYKINGKEYNEILSDMAIYHSQPTLPSGLNGGTQVMFDVMSAVGLGTTVADWLQTQTDIVEKYGGNPAEKMLRILNEGNKYRGKAVKSFRQRHLASAYTNIISNNIKADYRDVYTKVVVPTSNPSYGEISSKEKWTNRGSYTDTVSVQMNDFLAEEDVRTINIDFPNCVGYDLPNNGAYKYGTAELLRQSKKLYKGNIQLLADPNLKPCDYLILDDKQKDIFGPIEVREHVLSIAPGEGAISSVTPGMVSHVSNVASMSLLDAWWYFCTNKTAVDDAERLTAGFGPALLMGTAVYKAGTLVTGTGLLGATSVGSVPIIAVGAIIAADTAKKIVLAAKYREPIYLTPLTKNNIPYLVGMNHYKHGTLIEYIEHEWKLFTEGLGQFASYTSLMIKEAIKTISGENL